MAQGRVSGAVAGLTFGFFAGVCFAAAEIFWFGVISNVPPFLFLLYMFCGDVVLFSLVGAILGTILRFKSSDKVSAALFLVVLFFVYVANGVYRGSLPGLDDNMTKQGLAFLLLLLFSLPAAIYVHKKRLIPASHAYAANFILPVFIGAFSLVGVLVVNKTFLPDLLTGISLLSNFALGICFGGAFLLSLPLIRKQSLRRTGPAILTVIVFFSFFTALLSPVQKTIDAPEARDNREGAPGAGLFPVVLIVIDTLRADHMSTYGYHRKTTPHLDELAKDSLVFTHAISPSPWTLPAHASLFTGMLPSIHGADFVRYEEGGINKETTDRMSYRMPAVPLDESATTLAEILAENHYLCGAIVSNFAYLWRGFQLDQGFAFYDDARGVHIPLRPLFDMRHSAFLYNRFRHAMLEYANATNVTGRCINWLHEVRETSFFLFVNYMDVHRPYAPPPEYRKRYTSSDMVVAAVGPDVERKVSEGQRLPEEIRQQLVDLYDGELNYLDAEIGRLFDWMKTNGLYDSSLIIVTSDHGESLGEHNFLYHMNSLYEPEIHVPLIVKYPHAQKAGQIVTEATSLTAVPNLVLAALRMAPLAPPGPAISELEMNTDRALQYGSRFNRNLKAIYARGKKYIFDSAGKTEVYDLQTDPAEEVNLADQESESVRQMAMEIDNWLRLPKRNGLAQQSNAVTERISRERLKALGYLQ